MLYLQHATPVCINMTFTEAVRNISTLCYSSL